MASKRSSAALFQDKHEGNPTPAKTGYQKRAENIENEEYKNKHQPAVSNALKIKLDHMKTFPALTKNQQLFYDIYDRGDYFISLHGVAGSGKCQGEDVEVNLMVSDELYEKLIKMA